jgi:hypothetical protein
LPTIDEKFTFVKADVGEFGNNNNNNQHNNRQYGGGGLMALIAYGAQDIYI